jgi:peptidyl-prolyl cis-trans isomerase-like 3
MSVTLHLNVGDIKIELYNQEAPKACENFLALCASGFYNDSEFHRNIPGFMVQAGDDKHGGGGRSIWGGPFKDEIGGLRHRERGVVSMANSGPDSNMSQFFIAYDKQPSLDGLYTVFGHVIHGLETLEKMEKTPNDKHDRPLRPLVIRKVTIHANPFAT